MAVFFDRAAMTVSGTPGTGVITLASAYYKHQTFAAAGVTNGVTVAYAIEDGAAWEVGHGTYSSSGPTLTRTTIFFSSNANAAINASSSAIVYSTFLAEDIPGGATLAVSAGGTGATSLTGLIKGNGTSAFTAASQGTDYSRLSIATDVSAASQTSIDFTGIPTGVKRIMVIFNGISLSGTSNVDVRIGSGSIDATSYVSSFVFAGNATASGGNISTTGFYLHMGNAAANLVSGTMTLVNTSGNVWVESCSAALHGAGFGGAGGGTKTISGTLDRIRITTLNGTDTFDAGSVNITYEY